MKRGLYAMLAIVTLFSSFGAVLPSASAEGYDNTVNVNIDGIDAKTDNGNVFVYPNDSDEKRVIKAFDYGFRYTKLLVFDNEGMLIEAGGDIYENSATVTGAPQISVTVPPKGFLVAFKPSGASELNRAFNVAMEGAMLYNATMSVIYPVKASLNGNSLKLEYDNPKPASSSAKKFLFVGNSTTYFNGTPIKFKALCKAAGIEVDVEYCTFGSAYLSEFADETHERGVALRNKLKSKKYDYVVLQDAAAASYYTSKPAVDKIMPLIKENGAEALLYKRYSAADTLEQKIINAVKHHENYSTLAKNYSIKCANAADAFIYSCEKYPEINLYADDGGHHSKEGSYLIACTWLYTYLGIDPSGNGYTAQMEESVAAKLQECAKLAVENGYPYPSLDAKDEYKDKNGKVYQNIAFGKPYTTSGNAYNGDWTDTADGKPIGKLTDGKYATNGSEHAIGAYSSPTHSVTIDLGEISNVRAIKTDLWGNEGWGIKDPTTFTVKIEMSNDGVNFTELEAPKMSEETVNGDWKKRDFMLELGSPINARYIRVSYLNGTFVWSSEISVYGSVFGKDESLEESITEETSTENGFETTKNEKNAWLYWAIGAAVTALAVGVAVFISKKKK